jgi:hypothetical protein
VPSRPYSERFLYIAESPGLYQYTVPDGRRAVVRAIIATNPGAAAGTVQCFIGPCCIYHAVFQASTQTVSFDTRQVAYMGETIRLYTNGPKAHAIVSGYLFDDTEGRTKPTPDPGLPVPVPLEEQLAIDG